MYNTLGAVTYVSLKIQPCDYLIKKYILPSHEKKSHVVEF